VHRLTDAKEACHSRRQSTVRSPRTWAPDAIAELGDTLKADTLKAKGDVEGAKALWQRLRESVPSYAPKLEGRL
jgi:hypothetical protein